MEHFSVGKILCLKISEAVLKFRSTFVFEVLVFFHNAWSLLHMVQWFLFQEPICSVVGYLIKIALLFWLRLVKGFLWLYFRYFAYYVSLYYDHWTLFSFHYWKVLFLLEKFRIPHWKTKGTHTLYKIDGLLFSLSIGFEMESHTIKFNMVSEPIKPKRVFDPR